METFSHYKRVLSNTVFNLTEVHFSSAAGKSRQKTMIQLSLEVYYHNREFITITCVHVRDTSDKSFHTTDMHLVENICKCPLVQKHRNAENRLSQNYLARFSPLLDEMNTWHSAHLRIGINSPLQFESKENPIIFQIEVLY